jgi:hypothetical protein
VSYVLVAVIGYVTSLVTAHATPGLVAAAVALVLFGAALAAYQAIPDSTLRRWKGQGPAFRPPRPSR